MDININLKSTDDPNTVIANGVAIPANSDAPDPGPEEPPFDIEATFKEVSGFDFGTPRPGTAIPFKAHGKQLRPGWKHWRLVVAGEVAFDADVADNRTAGLRIRRVDEERAYWESKPGNEDIVAKIDAMNLPDDAFAVFPHGDGSRELPFYPVEWNEGEHSQWHIEDDAGNKMLIKIANKEPANSIVLTSLLSTALGGAAYKYAFG